MLRWQLLLSIALPPLCSAAAPFRLSLTLGDHAVLQRDAPSVLWGFAPPGVTVSAALNGAPLAPPVATDATGVWRAPFPAMPFGGPHTLSFAASDGSPPLEMKDVLIGDVFACGGQSNAAFSVNECFNASTEVQAANAYPFIRLLSVPPGQPQNGTATDLASVIPWAPASNLTVGAFSAVCYFHGKQRRQWCPLALFPAMWGGRALSTGPQLRAARLATPLP